MVLVVELSRVQRGSCTGPFPAQHQLCHRDALVVAPSVLIQQRVPLTLLSKALIVNSLLWIWGDQIFRACSGPSSPSVLPSSPIFLPRALFVFASLRRSRSGSRSGGWSRDSGCSRSAGWSRSGSSCCARHTSPLQASWRRKSSSSEHSGYPFPFPKQTGHGQQLISLWRSALPRQGGRLFF